MDERKGLKVGEHLPIFIEGFPESKLACLSVLWGASSSLETQGAFCLKKYSLKQHFLTLSCGYVTAHIYMVTMALNANQKTLLGFQEKNYGLF